MNTPNPTESRQNIWEKNWTSFHHHKAPTQKTPAFSQENDGASRWLEGRDMEIHWAGFYKDQPAGCSHQMVVYFSKGIHPKLAETLRLRIYV